MNDVIYRQAAIDAIRASTSKYTGFMEMEMYTDDDAVEAIKALPSAQKKGYTKADYIMALHKEYGCSLARAEKAHQKALEYLRNTSMMKG